MKSQKKTYIVKKKNTTSLKPINRSSKNSSTKHTIKTSKKHKYYKGTVMTIHKRKNKRHQSGGFFSSKKKSAIGRILERLKETEDELIKETNKYTEIKKKYYAILSEHTLNLKQFELMIPYARSFSKLFNDVVIDNYITTGEKINKNNPLFINAYSITEYSSPSEIITEHIRQQIRHIIKYRLGASNENIIREYYIKFEEDPEKDIVVNFLLATGNTTSRVFSHKEYMLDFDKAETELRDIIESAEKIAEPPLIPKEGKYLTPLQRYEKEKERKQKEIDAMQQQGFKIDNALRVGVDNAEIKIDKAPNAEKIKNILGNKNNNNKKNSFSDLLNAIKAKI